MKTSFTSRLSVLALSVSAVLGFKVELSISDPKTNEIMVFFKGEEIANVEKVAKYFKKNINDVEYDFEEGFTAVFFNL